MYIYINKYQYVYMYTETVCFLKVRDSIVALFIIVHTNRQCRYTYGKPYTSQV